MVGVNAFNLDDVPGASGAVGRSWAAYYKTFTACGYNVTFPLIEVAHTHANVMADAVDMGGEFDGFQAGDALFDGAGLRQVENVKLDTVPVTSFALYRAYKLRKRAVAHP